MNAIGKSLKVYAEPYLYYWINKKVRGKLTEPQRMMIDSMDHGMWYESDATQRITSLWAMVNKGWIIAAKVAKRVDGKLVEFTPEEMLARMIFEENPFAQPLLVFRRIKDDVQHCDATPQPKPVLDSAAASANPRLAEGA